MRSLRSRTVALLAGALVALSAPLAHAVTATVTELGGQPVGVSTLKLDGVPLTPDAEGNYTLPPGTHEVTVTTTAGGTFVSQVQIPDGSGSGRLTLEPGSGTISYAPGPAPAPGTPSSGVPSRLAEPVAAGGVAPRTPDGGWSLTAQADYEGWTLPRVASGVFVVGAGLDRPIKLSPEYVDGGGGALRLTQKNFRPGVQLRYDVSYFDGDAGNEAHVAPGPNVGFLFHRRAPNGSNGLSLGGAGMDVRTEVDFTRYKLGVTLWDQDLRDGQGLIGGLGPGGGSLGGSFGYGGPKLAGGIGVSWQRFETDQRSWLMSPTFGDLVTSNFHQQLTEDQFALGGTVKLSVPLAQNISAFGKLGGAVIYRRADLDGKQVNRCDPCAAPLDLFVADVDDRDSGVTWASNAALGLDVSLTPRFSVGAVGRYVYYHDTGDIMNPVQGDASLYRPTSLDDRRAHAWQVGIGVTYQF